MSEEEFKKAVSYVQEGPPISNITNEIKLKFYALYKQATEGPCKTSAPSKLKIVQRAKWDAWKKLGDMSKEEAMKKYIQQLNELAPEWNNVKSKL